MKKLILLVSILLFLVNLSFTQIIHIPADYATIQAGINAAGTGDTVLVAPGTYYEHLDISEKNIKLASWFLITSDTSYISQTVLNGSQNDIVIRIRDVDSTCVVCGFTITNGYAITLGNGGGLSLKYASPKLNNLVITENKSYEHGGGISCSMNSFPLLDDVIISNNIAENGSGGGMICKTPGSVNEQSKQQNTLELRDVTFSGNSANMNGGGFCDDFWVNVTFTNVTFTNNYAGRDGGGIYYIYEAIISLEDVKFINNIAGREGGGLWCFFSVINLENVLFSYNSAKKGGGMYLFAQLNSSIFKNILFDHNNASETGGGLFCDNADLVFQNITCAENDADTGTAIYCYNSHLVLWSSIVFGNVQPQQIVFAESGDQNEISISHSLIQGGINNINTNGNGTINWLDGNINQNPNFVGSGEHPCQINDYSPCIDAGTPDTTGLNLPEFDLAGEIRVFNDRVDMGAYEWNLFVGENEYEPQSFKLEVECYPNPFSTSTTIEYNLRSPETVQITIFNHLGKQVEIIQQKQTAGKQQIIWNAEGLPSGIYYFTLQAGEQMASGKMVVAR